MTPLRRPRHRRHPPGAVAAVALVALTLAGGSAREAGAHNTVTFDGAGQEAPDIGLIGDSTLSGVRWWARYGDLRRYNFVLDAESCRRTVEGVLLESRGLSARQHGRPRCNAWPVDGATCWS